MIFIVENGLKKDKIPDLRVEVDFVKVREPINMNPLQFNEVDVTLQVNPGELNIDVQPIPEPLTILGTGVVLGAIPVLKKEYAKRNKKKDEDA